MKFGEIDYNLHNSIQYNIKMEKPVKIMARE